MALLTELSEVSLFIYGAVLAVYLPLPNFQSTFLQIYILFQIMFKPKIFLVIILIALIPLILVAVVIYFLCCRKSKKVNLPKRKEVTM